MRVLSLFDGISCGRVALERAGIKVQKYYASEIDKDAIKISQSNYDDIIHIGDITKVFYSNGILKTENAEYEVEFDLVIAGSPCTSFSKAGAQKGFEGESGLYWHFHRILNEVKPKYFLLENVKMKKEWPDIITESLGVEPIFINSRDFVPQNRPRLYWTNIPVDLHVQKQTVLKDILEDSVEEKFMLSQKAKDYMSRERNGKPRWEYHTNILDGVASCLTANMFKGVPYGVIRELERRLTPLECERLQGLPDFYTIGVSNTSRYKAIGNGWTVDVIAHIFKNL